MKKLVFALLILSLAGTTFSQQVSDSAFHYNNTKPIFSAGSGPTVCIDEAHYNYHTKDGRYQPFARLVSDDGYKVSALKQSFSAATLEACNILVIANALAADNANNWQYPHPSAFSREEIVALMIWVREGGSLLLIADHAPFAGAASDLGATLGLMMLDSYVFPNQGSPAVFLKSNNSLRAHAISTGRNNLEQVNSVATFTGQAAQITEGWSPLLVLGQNAQARINLQQTFQQGATNEWPVFSVAGWAQGAAKEWDSGRVVFMGEAAMCSAQVSGQNQTPAGMNHPGARENAQFCLNIVRWLSRSI